MSVTTTTTTINRKWLERKPKHELASIIMNNIDKIDLFAEEPRPTQWAYDQACKAIEKHRTHAEHLRADMDTARNFCQRAQKMTEVPAAEYVPALSDAWEEIQKAIQVLS